MKNLPSKKTTVSSFLEATKKHPVVKGQRVRLVFAMDATASREPTWDMATSLHGELFNTAKARNLSVQLVYYRGFHEFHASSWNDSPASLLQSMQDVRCLGGVTQIARVLTHIRKEASASELRAAVFIGDACEENPLELFSMAGELGLYRVPVFLFQEGENPLARSVFAGIAQRTNGAHVPFQPGSSRQLAELLGAVATYATEGIDAIRKLKGSMATKLLTQMRH